MAYRSRLRHIVKGQDPGGEQLGTQFGQLGGRRQKSYGFVNDGLSGVICEVVAEHQYDSGSAPVIINYHQLGT